MGDSHRRNMSRPAPVIARLAIAALVFIAAWSPVDALDAVDAVVPESRASTASGPTYVDSLVTASTASGPTYVDSLVDNADDSGETVYHSEAQVKSYCDQTAACLGYYAAANNAYWRGLRRSSCELLVHWQPRLHSAKEAAAAAANVCQQPREQCRRQRRDGVPQ